MRLHPLFIVLSIPAMFLACSSGGSGSVPSPGGNSAFGQPGAVVPALAPPGGGGGAQTPDPPDPKQDTGTTTTDTGGGGTDTGRTDTGGGNAVCSRPSKCSDTFIPAATCNAAIAKCGTVGQAYFECLSDNQVCKPDGTTDPGATASPCSEQGMAYQACAGA